MDLKVELDTRLAFWGYGVPGVIRDKIIDWVEEMMATRDDKIAALTEENQALRELDPGECR